MNAVVRIEALQRAEGAIARRTRMLLETSLDAAEGRAKDWPAELAAALDVEAAALERAAECLKARARLIARDAG